MQTFAQTAGARRVRWIDGELEVLLTASDTGGTLGMWRFRSDAGAAAPLHVHQHEDEQFHVLSGRVAYLIDQKRIELGPGDTLAIPRGVPHAYLVLEACEAIGSVTPGGFESFFLDVGKPVETHDAPSMPELAAGSAKVGVDLLGPPPIDQLAG